MRFNTMRLTSTPDEAYATRVRHSWDAIYNAYGFETFHPVEAKGVLMAIWGIRRDEVERILQIFLDRGYAIAP